jgi:GntR family transcriptional regulator, transcriptional repressor for pyruvate dehydrogenase complex
VQRAERLDLANSPRPSLSDEVVRRVVELILDEGLRPGDKLPSERELTARLSVGRSSLREAIKTLAALGVVEVAVGSGMYVADGESSLLTRPLSWGLLMGERSTREVIEARRVVEVELAGLAAERATEEEVAAIGEELALLGVNLADAEKFTRHDLAFHLAVARAAHNRVLYHVLDTLRHVLRAWFIEAFPRRAGDSEMTRRHPRVYDAIRRRDAAGARQAMTEHVEGAAAWLLETTALDLKNGRATEGGSAAPSSTGIGGGTQDGRPA